MYWNNISDFPTRWKTTLRTGSLKQIYTNGPQRTRAQDLSTKPERLSAPEDLDGSMSVSLRNTSDAVMRNAGMMSSFVDWREGIVASSSGEGGR